MPKTSTTLNELRTAYEQWLGTPAKIQQFQRNEENPDVPTSMEILFFQPDDIDAAPDDDVFTYLVTVGLSTRLTSGPLPQVELSMRVDGHQTSEALEALAQWLAEFGTIPFREGQYLVPDLVVHDVHMPLFESMEATLITHWNTSTAKQLPGLIPPVVVLRVLPLYLTEAEVAAEIGAAETVRCFMAENINRHRPNRQPANLKPIPPMPEIEQEVGTTSLADPAALADDIWDDITKWLQQNAPQQVGDLLPGASNDQINRLELNTGRAMPDDYKASLRRHNGAISLNNYRYLPADEVISFWQGMQRLNQKKVFVDLQPIYNQGQELQDVWWHSGWIPFAADTGGNYLCIDTAPGPNGIFGQILLWERVEGPSLSEHSSVLAWLRVLRDNLYRDHDNNNSQ